MSLHSKIKIISHCNYLKIGLNETLSGQVEYKDCAHLIFIDTRVFKTMLDLYKNIFFEQGVILNNSLLFIIRTGHFFHEKIKLPEDFNQISINDNIEDVIFNVKKRVLLDNDEKFKKNLYTANFFLYLSELTTLTKTEIAILESLKISGGDVISSCNINKRTCYCHLLNIRKKLYRVSKDDLLDFYTNKRNNCTNNH